MLRRLKLYKASTVCYMMAAVVVSACGPQADSEPPGPAPVRSSTPAHGELGALGKVIEAHGGIERWRSYGTLEFDLVRDDVSERHLVNLRTRQIRIVASEYTIGFDGAKTWVDPSLGAYSGNPHFYSAVHFYFFAMPFVLADPGTVHRDLAPMTMDGREYSGTETTFDPGTGAAPKDAYRVYANPDTGRMALLLYTNTYRTQQASTSFNARVYSDWQEVDGLVVPAKYEPHAWNADTGTLGDKRGEYVFRNVRFRTEEPESSLFNVPEGGEVWTSETP